ncbi:MAG: Aliphatic amidase AmiE, partial [uncultured Solirubrobacterales bacterium]
APHVQVAERDLRRRSVRRAGEHREDPRYAREATQEPLDPGHRRDRGSVRARPRRLYRAHRQLGAPCAPAWGGARRVPGVCARRLRARAAARPDTHARAAARRAPGRAGDRPPRRARRADDGLPRPHRGGDRRSVLDRSLPERRRRARPSAQGPHPAGRDALLLAGRGLRGLRHPGRAHGHAALLRQALPGGRALAHPRRGRHHRRPRSLADLSQGRRPPDLARPPDPPVQSRRRDARDREPGRTGLDQSDRLLRRRALPRQRQGRGSPRRRPRPHRGARADGAGPRRRGRGDRRRPRADLPPRSSSPEGLSARGGQAPGFQTDLDLV